MTTYTSSNGPTALKSFMLFKESQKTLNVQFPLSTVPEAEKKHIIHPGNASRMTACAVSVGVFAFGDEYGGIHVRPLNSKEASTTIHTYAHFKRNIQALKFFRDNAYLIAIGEYVASEPEQQQQQQGKAPKKFLSKACIFEITPTKLELKQTFGLVNEADTEEVTIVDVDINENDSLVSVAFFAKKKASYGTVAVFNTVLPQISDKTPSLHSSITLNNIPTSIGFSKTQVLYVSTDADIYQFVFNSMSYKKFVLETSQGCPSGCGAVTSGGDFVIANKNGIFKYRNELEKSNDPDRVKVLYAKQLQDDPKLVTCLAPSYVITVTKDEADVTDDKNKRNVLTIFDFDGSDSYKAYEQLAPQKTQIETILNERTRKTLFVVTCQQTDAPSTASGVPNYYVIRPLEEKDTQARLDFLSKKNEYELAIRLAKKTQRTTGNDVVETTRKYGDYLFSKQDFETAVKKYMETIPDLEPSYVIRKFLDAQQTKFLIQYLEDLHKKKHANNDHTILLLNCYTRLRDEKQQEMDIQAKKSKQNVQSEVDTVIEQLQKFLFESNSFDPRTAISVLRQTGYRKLALQLAAKFPTTRDFIIKIHIEDFPDEDPISHFTEALQHIEQCPYDQALAFMKEYAKILLTKLPYKTTNVLIRLCARLYTKIDVPTASRRIFSKDAEEDGNTSLSSSFDVLGETACAKDFIYAYADQSYWLMVFLENCVHRIDYDPKLLPPVVYNTLLELYLKYWTTNPNFSDSFNAEPDFYKAFFTELYPGVKLDELKQLEDKENLYKIDPPKMELAKQNFATKINNLLEGAQTEDSKTRQYITYYDKEHALVLVQAKKFIDGILFIHRQLGLYYDVLQHYMEEGLYDDVINTANTYGTDDPNMWIQVLSYFAAEAPNQKTKRATTDFKPYITKVLNIINQADYLPPLLVVQILAQNDKTELSIVKEFLKDKLKNEQDKTQGYMDEIKKYQEETKQLQEEIEELRTTAKIFQVTTCSQCLKPLDLPTVHFMCMHSYHQRCLAADVEECTKCAAKNKENIKTTKMYEDQANMQAKFFASLSATKSDGFDIVSEYFGKGIFKPSVFAGDD